MFEKIKSFLFENKTPKQTVAKNTVWLTISNFGGRLIKAIIVIYAARVLGTAGYGLFSYAVTLAGFVGIFLDPGINAVLLRDSAKSDEKERRTIFSTTFVIKIFLIILGVSLVVFLGPLFSTLPGSAILLPIAALILTFDTIREFLFSLLRSMEKMQWEAGVFLLTNTVVVIGGFIFLAISPTAKSLLWGYALGSTVGGVIAIVIVWDYIKNAFSQFSLKLTIPIIQSAWPFAVTGAIGLLFTNTDILIISWMKTASDVGIYSAAIRIIQVLYLIPGVIQLTTLPLFSRLAKKDDQKFRLVLERTVGLVFLAAVPMTVGGIILGTQIMTVIFGGTFASGGLAFKLLIATLIVDFSGSIIVNAVFAYAHQKSLIITSAVGGITNVLFDVLLIPRFGITGSAVATLIAQTVTNAYLWHVMKKINYFEIMPRLKKIIPAAIIMGAATTIFYSAGLNVILNIAISTGIYLASLKLLGEPLIIEMRDVLVPTATTSL